MASATAGRSWSDGLRTSSGAAGEPVERDVEPAMVHLLRHSSPQVLVPVGRAPVIGYHLATGAVDGVYCCYRVDPAPG